jgi:hypothetical protein
MNILLRLLRSMLMICSFRRSNLMGAVPKCEFDKGTCKENVRLLIIHCLRAARARIDWTLKDCSGILHSLVDVTMEPHTRDIRKTTSVLWKLKTRGLSPIPFLAEQLLELFGTLKARVYFTSRNCSSRRFKYIAKCKAVTANPKLGSVRNHSWIEPLCSTSQWSYTRTF